MENEHFVDVIVLGEVSNDVELTFKVYIQFESGHCLFERVGSNVNQAVCKNIFNMYVI
jgi:hypothetical protein